MLCFLKKYYVLYFIINFVGIFDMRENVKVNNYRIFKKYEMFVYESYFYFNLCGIL